MTIIIIKNYKLMCIVIIIIIFLKTIVITYYSSDLRLHSKNKSLRFLYVSHLIPNPTHTHTQSERA